MGWVAAAIAALVAYLLALTVFHQNTATAKIRAEAVNVGCAQYSPQTGVFEFKLLR